MLSLYDVCIFYEGFTRVGINEGIFRNQGFLYAKEIDQCLVVIRICNFIS